MRKRILCALCCVLLLCALPLAAFAQDVPDFGRLGSVAVTLTHKGEAVTGGSFTLYRVAQIAQNGPDYWFQPVDALLGYGFSLEQLNDSRLAQTIYDGVKKEALPGTIQSLDENGSVVFENLSLGLYLLVQEQACPGYHEVEPFLVALPNRENGAYRYDVDASPKVELETAPTTEPSEPTDPSEPGEPPTEVTVPGKLPQTGQNNWPVPVMLIVGGLFVVTGFWLHYSGKEKKHET